MVINSMHICLVYRFYILQCFMQEIKVRQINSQFEISLVQLIATSTSMDRSTDCTSFRGHNTVCCFLCSPMFKLSLQVHTVYIQHAIVSKIIHYIFQINFVEINEGNLTLTLTCQSVSLQQSFSYCTSGIIDIRNVLQREVAAVPSTLYEN